MIPYGRQNIIEEDIDAVVEILRSDWLTQGPMVPRFESIIANYCGAKHSVAVNSATSALHIACMALDVGPGDIVWTSPNTFVASANCAIYCGATIDFVDINPRTYNMNVNLLREKLETAKNEGQLPKVVIPVHFCGQSCEMSEIHNLSKQYGFSIIEDASHAIGASYKGDPVGSCKYSDITVFSFHPVKIITTGEGGMALTNEPILFERLQSYRSHGITSTDSHMKKRPENEIWNYQQIRLGYNYRMTDILAVLGISQMKRLDEFIMKRQQIAKIYDDAFEGLPIRTPWQHPDTLSSFHLYPIRVNYTESGKTQKQVYEEFHKANIIVNLHYIPVYRQPFYEDMGFRSGYCPESELYHRETISLPIFPTLKMDEIDYIIKTLKQILD